MDTVFRTTAVYLVLMLGFRLLGKRELARMSPFELVTVVLVAEVAAPALTRQDGSLTNAFVGVATLFTLVFATSFLSFYWARVRRVVQGEPTVVVKHGRLVEDALARERITEEELIGEMHRAGLDHVEQVEWGIVETTGDMTFVPRRDEEAQPEGQ